MTYRATVEGNYKSRLYINLIFFKIARGWRTDPFKWSQDVATPNIRLSTFPVKNLPIEVFFEADPTGVTASLRLANYDVPLIHQSFPVGGAQSFHWEPVKGVIVDGTASFVQVS